MKKLRISDMLSHLLGTAPSSPSSHYCSKRNGLLASVFLGFCFVLGGSILVLTIISFMCPSMFPQNHLEIYYLKFSFPRWQNSPAGTSSSPITSTSNNTLTQTHDDHAEHSLNFTSSSINVVPVDHTPGALVVTEDTSVPTSSTNSTKMAMGMKLGNGDENSSGGGDCDIFEGEWVMVNDRKPYYPPGSCPYIQTQATNCYSNGRSDVEYLKWQWRWQSHPTNAGCSKNIPSFLNATDLLERLRGKKLVFAGDSLNRNMYKSMVCILWNAISDKSRIISSGGDFSITYKDYNCTVAFVWTAFLVNHLGVFTPEKETLRLDLIDEPSASRYGDADIIVFDAWHWWNYQKTHDGINFFQEGDYLYPKLDINIAYTKALTTWSNWIDRNIDSNKTQVVFRGFSLTHFAGGKWNTGGGCNLETEPIPSNETYVKPSPVQLKILEDTLGKMKTDVLYLNVSKLTYYRADAHPSVYGKNYTAQERIVAPQDCSHWCLPGVPDTWNELLYATLLKAGKGSFSN
ncbi:hypothetical protein MKW92_006625 [Papaver armeniacum]|nr:hypothetical protein MKW92_006625 [Papaver armeniacum]